MRVFPLIFRRGFLILSLLLVLSLCNADGKTFEVVGMGECADCKEKNLESSQAFSGLHVTIDCKLKNGEIKRVGDGELDEGGRFRISLSQQADKEECYAQLHSAATIPCPALGGLEAAKIVPKSQANGKYMFTTTKTLQFSSALCTSKSFLPYFKYPPFSKSHSWKKNWPKISFPPLYNPKPPTAKPPPPAYKPKPKPPAIKPPPPTYKPEPPAHKPKPPSHEPSHPPPAPIYKPKPKPPVAKPPPPPAPAYKPPVVAKPLPPPFPLYPIPPFYKKPCPPFSKIPPKYFHHPKFGYFPPLPPFFPQP